MRKRKLGALSQAAAAALLLSMSSMLGLALAACSDSAGPGATGGNGASPGNAGGDGGMGASGPFASGAPLDVPVPDTGRVYVKLGTTPSLVTPSGDPKAQTDWDMAFEGFDVFTNGGASGSGMSSAFGPIDSSAFASSTMPEIPFLTADATGGAFQKWYLYSGAPEHVLWSRFHVFGVKEGARTWKVQVVTYYGQRDGAPIAGLYHIRYAELLPGGPGPVQDIVNLDGTAGGTAAPASAPSEAIDLATGMRTMLTPDQAQTSSAWQLYFRRESIRVNGEMGGPRGVGAVDLDAGSVQTEVLADVKTRTADSELPHFMGISTSSFSGAAFRGDHVVSAFGSLWLDPISSQKPVAPSQVAWLVVDAAGKQKYLVGFTGFTNPTAKAPGTIGLRVKPIQG
jgi:hypothetical protein